MQFRLFHGFPLKTETVMINRVLLFDKLFLPFLKVMYIFGIEIDSNKQPTLFYKNFDYPEKTLKYKHIRRISD